MIIGWGRNIFYILKHNNNNNFKTVIKYPISNLPKLITFLKEM